MSHPPGTARALRPDGRDLAPYQIPYVARVPDGDIVQSLEEGGAAAAAFLSELPEAVARHRYAPGKWTLGQVVLHCSDAERIFAYRAVRIARGDPTDLPGWDEGAYAPVSGAEGRTLGSLVAEFRSVRAASVTLFDGLPLEGWERRGRANGFEVSVRALAWITAGHLLHHLDLIRNRYLEP